MIFTFDITTRNRFCGPFSAILYWKSLKISKFRKNFKSEIIFFFQLLRTSQWNCIFAWLLSSVKNSNLSPHWLIGSAPIRKRQSSSPYTWAALFVALRTEPIKAPGASVSALAFIAAVGRRASDQRLHSILTSPFAAMPRVLLTGLILTLLLLLHHSSCFSTAQLDSSFDEDEAYDRLTTIYRRLLDLERASTTNEEAEDELRPSELWVVFNRQCVRRVRVERVFTP